MTNSCEFAEVLHEIAADMGHEDRLMPPCRIDMTLGL